MSGIVIKCEVVVVIVCRVLSSLSGVVLPEGGVCVIVFLSGPGVSVVAVLSYSMEWVLVWCVVCVLSPSVMWVLSPVIGCVLCLSVMSIVCLSGVIVRCFVCGLSLSGEVLCVFVVCVRWASVSCELSLCGVVSVCLVCVVILVWVVVLSMVGVIVMFRVMSVIGVGRLYLSVVCVVGLSTLCVLSLSGV